MDRCSFPTVQQPPYQLETDFVVDVSQTVHLIGASLSLRLTTCPSDGGNPSTSTACVPHDRPSLRASRTADHHCASRTATPLIVEFIRTHRGRGEATGLGIAAPFVTFTQRSARPRCPVHRAASAVPVFGRAGRDSGIPGDRFPLLSAGATDRFPTNTPSSERPRQRPRPGHV